MGGADASAALRATIHRQLLRLGRQLDRQPIGKAFLLAQPERIFDRTRGAVVTPPLLKNISGQLAADLSRFNRGEFYRPSRSVYMAVLEACPVASVRASSRLFFSVSRPIAASWPPNCRFLAARLPLRRRVAPAPRASLRQIHSTSASLRCACSAPRRPLARR